MDCPLGAAGESVVAPELQLCLSYQILVEHDLWFIQGVFVVYMCRFLSYPHFVFVVISNEKQSIKNNSEPGLVMGYALLSEGKAYTECPVINEP